MSLKLSVYESFMVDEDHFQQFSHCLCPSFDTHHTGRFALHLYILCETILSYHALDPLLSRCRVGKLVTTRQIPAIFCICCFLGLSLAFSSHLWSFLCCILTFSILILDQLFFLRVEVRITVCRFLWPPCCYIFLGPALGYGVIISGVFWILWGKTTCAMWSCLIRIRCIAAITVIMWYWSFSRILLGLPMLCWKICLILLHAWWKICLIRLVSNVRYVIVLISLWIVWVGVIWRITIGCTLLLRAICDKARKKLVIAQRYFCWKGRYHTHWSHFGC